MNSEMNGEEFKRLRLELGLNTRKKAGDVIGVTCHAVKMWEFGFRRVPQYAVKALVFYGKSKRKKRPGK